jgi:ABC-type amino acid transport substrate-binding protein
MKRIIVFFCMLVFLVSCGSSSKPLRIGIDPNWYPQNFQGKEFYINGFIDDLLLEISKDSGLEIVKVTANWDSLLDGVKQHRYEAVLSTMPSYNFNLAKYDFSHNVLDIGPVMVTSASSSAKHIQEMKQKFVGVLPGNEFLIIQQYPEVLARTYDSIPEIFDAMVNNDVEAILVDRLVAVGYVSGVYAGKLKIIGHPLNQLGIHLLTMKGQNTEVLKTFDKSLKHLKKKKRLQKLYKKWQLEI